MTTFQTSTLLASSSASQMATLKLNRAHTNHAFGSWKYSKDLIQGHERIPLPEPVSNPESTGHGFLSTRAHVMHNHLHQLGNEVFFFVGGEHSRLLQYEGRSIIPVVSISDGKAERGDLGGLIEPALPPSVISMTPTGSNTAPPPLLVSSGGGDISLVSRIGGGVSTGVVFLLLPAAPLRGVRPFVLLAAYQPDPDTVQAVVWAIRPKTESRPAVCEVFLVTLRCSAASGSPVEHLRVTAVQLLRTTATPPFAAVVDAATNSVLLALDPEGAELASLPGTPSVAPGSGAVTEEGAAKEEEAEEVDANPRSLQQAVEALAKFTSDEPAPEGPKEHVADLYNESGPGGEGALGSEPACCLHLFSCTPVGPGVTATAVEVQQLTCSPLRLLGVRTAAGSTSVLLGLADDVDCAVVEVSISPPSSGDAAAVPVVASAAGVPVGSGDSGGVGGSPSIAVQHLSSVPALAYVAAGKMQRKHLLLSAPGGSVAAALVEAQTFAYVYSATEKRQMHGDSALIDLQSEMEVAEVLGAALITADKDSGSQLLVLTSDELQEFRIR